MIKFKTIFCGSDSEEVPFCEKRLKKTINEWIEENPGIYVYKESMCQVRPGEIIFMYDDNSEMNTNYWMKEGEKIDPADMSTKYIRNCMKKLRETYKDTCFDFLIYKLFQTELIIRHEKNEQ